MRITVERATELETVVQEIADDAGELVEALANLQDEGLRGEERDDASDEVETAFERLCSNVRALAKGLRVMAELELEAER